MDWLAFSLSNQPGFLDSFNQTVPTTNHVGGAVENGEENRNGGGSSPSDLALAGPKLENFLGVCGEPPSGDHGVGRGMYHSSRKTSLTSGLLSDYQSDRLESDCSKAVLPQTEPNKSVDTFGQRTSIYRGVTRHRWTGRYEAHLWDNSCRREGQSRKGRQVYLGGYDKEEKAARAYDLAAIKYWGPTTNTNFLMPNYEKEIEEMKNMTRQEFVASLRRKSSGFSRGASIYRGVTRHHQHGRWQARIGRVAGNKDLYLGTFSSQEEAAEAYDIAAIKFRGLNAVTNFDMSRYDVKCIANSNLPIGGMSGRTSNSKNVVSPPDQSPCSSSDTKGRTVDLAYGLAMQQQQQQKQQQEHDYWSFLALHQQTIQQGSNYRDDNDENDNNNNSYLNVFPCGGANMDFSTGVTTAVDAQGKNGNYMWNCSGGDDDVYIMQHSCDQTQQDDEEEVEKTNRDSSTGGGGVCYSTIPYATPNALGTGYENESGSWVTLQPSSSNHAYPQTATKTNMGVFQTPIFGME